MFHYNTFLFLFSLYLCERCNGQCFDVQQCSGQISNPIGSLNYEIKIAAWNGDETAICPRSDSTVPQWTITFNTNSSIATNNRTICSLGVAFQSSEVCTSNDKLIIYVSPGFVGKEGVLRFRLIDDSVPYDSTFNISYAPTGAYPEQTTVYAQVSQLFVALSWYIYSANSDTDIKTYYREQLLTEDVMSNNNMKYSAHKDDTNRCLPSESSESTTFFNLFVLHPTLASAGEYTLVQDVYSVTITLEVIPVPSSSLNIPLSSSQSLMTTSNSAIPSLSSSFSASFTFESSQQVLSTSAIITSSPVPTSQPSSNNYLTIILPSVLVPLAFILAIIVAIIAILIVCKFHQKKGDPSFMKQYSQDPEHKIHGDLQPKSTSTIKETETDETDSRYISMKPLDHDSSPTTPLKAVSNGLPPSQHGNGTCVGMDPHGTELQRTANGQSQSFSSMSKTRQDKEQSPHKVLFSGNLQANTKSNVEETEMQETDMHCTTEIPVCQDSTLTTTSKPLSISSHSENNVQMRVNPRISDVQKAADGHTHSFPSTPKIDSKREYKDGLSSRSESTIEGLMKEQIVWLKKIHKQTKRSGDHQEKIAGNAEKLVSLQEDHNENLQNITGSLELLAVAEKDGASSENDDDVTESSRPEVVAGHLEGDRRQKVSVDKAEDDEGYCGEKTHSMNGTPNRSLH